MTSSDWNLTALVDLVIRDVRQIDLAGDCSQSGDADDHGLGRELTVAPQTTYRV